MNPAAEALLGVSLRISLHKGIREITSEAALLNYLDQIDQYASPDDDIDLDLFDHFRNEMRIIQARASQLKDRRDTAAWVVSLRDVTQVREVARLKSEFISTAAHELRTPLATISGFTELLLEEDFRAETRQEYLGYIIDKADALSKIIDDLLDLSRIESGRGLSLNYSNWNLASTLEKIISRYSVEHPDYDFIATIQEDLGMVHADHGKIIQAIDNLLSNAIKYSPKQSKIWLEADAEDDLFTLTVRDQGIGMTEEQAAKCFEKFYRVDASNTAIGGLGLGLSIVRHVIESHHGEIRIGSREGHGTSVTFTIPRRTSREMQDQDEDYVRDVFEPRPQA